MGKNRDFTAATIEIMMENVDESPGKIGAPGGFWDWIKNYMLGNEVPGLDETLGSTQKYFEYILEKNDIYAGKLVEILEDVWENERYYAGRFESAFHNFEDYRTGMKQLADSIGAGSFVLDFNGYEAYLGLSGIRDWKLDPEAQALVEKQLEAAKLRYLVSTMGPLFSDALAALMAAGATTITGIGGIADISQLMADIENYNRRNPDKAIPMPKLSEEQQAAVDKYRDDIEAGRDPLNGAGPVSQGYPKYWTDDGIHNGVDFAAPAGTPIRATDYGEVVEAGWNNSYGNYVKIKIPGGGPNGEDLYITYAHMQQTPSVKVGDMVVPGSSLGKVGNTGFSFGNHLHLDVHVDSPTGLYACPWAYLPQEQIPTDFIKRNPDGSLMKDANGKYVLLDVVANTMVKYEGNGKNVIYYNGDPMSYADWETIYLKPEQAENGIPIK